MAHPMRTELSAFLTGQLPESAATVVEHHLDACPECREVVEGLLSVPPEIRAALVVSAGSHPLAGTRSATPEISGYRDLRELGRGGCGVVYRAFDVVGDRLVAIKVLRSGVFAAQSERAGFLCEAEAASRLHHPNIVEVYATGGQHAVPYYVMEYAAGGSLAGKLNGTPLSPVVAARLVRAVALAVQVAHSHGTIHRDLKPGNILLDDGDDPFATPKVADFGMAKSSDIAAFVTPTQAVLGTPSYMAPEQAFGNSRRVGPTADVYSLGAILYEMLTGRPPFKGETPYETLLQVRELNLVWPRTLRPEIPKALEAVCLKCLDAIPAERYPSAEQLAADLDNVLQNRQVTAKHPGLPKRLRRWMKANRATTMLIGLFVTAVATGMIAVLILWFRADRDRAAAVFSAEEATRSRIEARKSLALYASTANRLFRSPESMTPDEKSRLIKSIRNAEAVLSAPTGDPDEEHSSAFALLQLADGLHTLRDADAAISACRAGLSVLKRLAEQHPERDRFVFDYSQGSAQLWGTLGPVGTEDEKRTLLREAVRAAEVVHERRKGNTEVEGALASYQSKQATESLRAGRFDEAFEYASAAVVHLRRLADAYPEDATRYVYLDAALVTQAEVGLVRDGSADLFLAYARRDIETFRRCRSLHARPDWKTVLLRLAGHGVAPAALDWTQRHVEARSVREASIAALDELMALDPKDQNTQYELAGALHLFARKTWETDTRAATGRFQRSLSLLERSLADDSVAGVRGRCQLAILLASAPDPGIRNPQRAIEIARKDSTRVEYSYTLGIALFEAREFQEAKHVLSGYLRWGEQNLLFEEFIAIRSYYARTLWNLGEHVSAREAFEKMETKFQRVINKGANGYEERAAAWKLIQGKEPPDGFMKK